MSFPLALYSLAQLPARSLARTYLVQLFPSAMHLSAVLLAIATFTAVSAFDYTVSATVTAIAQQPPPPTGAGHAY